MRLVRLSAVLLPALLLAACSKSPLIVTRSACPAVAVPAYTGDVTLFDRPGSTEAAAIDVVAAITNVRGTCSDAGGNLVTNVSFDVVARRGNAGGAREVSLPYFVSVVRAGDRLIAKQMGQVTLRFADGDDRAVAQGTAQSTVSRAAASLPEEIERKITRERKPGDADAAIDPLADPEVRETVRQASFEVLVGFQLTGEQLAYNATK